MWIDADTHASKQGLREPHSYSNLLHTQESPSIVNLTGPNTSHVIQGNLFCTTTFVESLKETNIIEIKQQKSKSNRKSKVAEYTIFANKFQMPEYTTFQDGGSNSLLHVNSELLVSYSKFPFKKIDFLIKPTVLVVVHSPSFPSVCITASAAYARKIAAHLRWRR